MLRLAAVRLCVFLVVTYFLSFWIGMTYVDGQTVTPHKHRTTQVTDIQVTEINPNNLQQKVG